MAKELRRVLDEGRIACFVVDDTLINGKKYPIVADITKIFVEEDFKYRDKIIWVKPEGYIRISRRSGVLIQHPFPMYYYPDNLQESILIFQNGKFDYSRIPKEEKQKSKIDLEETQKGKWYLNVWNITNVLPLNNRLEKGIAAFDKESSLSEKLQLESSVEVSPRRGGFDRVRMRIKEEFDVLSESFLEFVKDCFNSYKRVS